MPFEIINKELQLTVSGFSGVATNKNYGATAIALADKTWPIVKSKGLKNKGLNIWIYEEEEKVFAGVELEGPPDQDLELKLVRLSHYAYYKHTGPYSLLGAAGENMRSQIRQAGFRPCLPFIEIYGHWTEDDSKLQTELLMAIEQPCGKP